MNASNSIRDTTSSGVLSAIVPNTLGSTTKSIVPNDNKAGSVTTLVTTINKLSNGLISGDKIEIGPLPSNWILDSGSSTSCTVVHNSVSKTVSSTSASGTTIVVVLGQSLTDGAFDTVLSCSNVKTGNQEANAISSIGIKTKSSSDEVRDMNVSHAGRDWVLNMISSRF